MIEMERLRVSLTKNGFQKIAELVQRYRRWEILDHVAGSEPGVNLVRSQVANILGVDPTTGSVPMFWDEIRGRGKRAIRSFSFFAVVLSHHELIEIFRRIKPGTFLGSIRRDEIGSKQYTNLQFAMYGLGLCDYVVGADSVDFDLYPAIYDLRDSGDLVRCLVASKLAKCGWLDPEVNKGSGNLDFLGICREQSIHRVFGMDAKVFKDWMGGDLEIDSPGNRPVPIANSRSRFRPSQKR